MTGSQAQHWRTVAHVTADYSVVFLLMQPTANDTEETCVLNMVEHVASAAVVSPPVLEMVQCPTQT